MVKATHWSATVPYEEVVLAQGFEVAVLLTVLEQPGLIMLGEGWRRPSFGWRRHRRYGRFLRR